jgi:hypothetical protein
VYTLREIRIENVEMVPLRMVAILVKFKSPARVDRFKFPDMAGMSVMKLIMTLL